MEAQQIYREDLISKMKTLTIDTSGRRNYKKK